MGIILSKKPLSSKIASNISFWTICAHVWDRQFYLKIERLILLKGDSSQLFSNSSRFFQKLHKLCPHIRFFCISLDLPYLATFPLSFIQCFVPESWLTFIFSLGALSNQRIAAIVQVGCKFQNKNICTSHYQHQRKSWLLYLIRFITMPCHCFQANIF